MEIDPHIIRLDPIRELTWGGEIRGILYGEHIFVIEEINTNQTRLIHKEDFTGFTVPFASLDSIKEGYELMNEALKTRAELSNKLAIE